MVERNLILINSPEDPPTFYSRRWKSQSTPDIAIATEDIEQDTTRNVTNKLGGSDHKPVLIIISKTSAPLVTKMPASRNYRKKPTGPNLPHRSKMVQQNSTNLRL